MSNKKSHRAIGDIAEDRVAKHLESKGYKILERNYQIKGGEIDIITKKDEQIIFFEVKYRKNENFGHPLDTMTPSKCHALKRTIFFYCHKNKINPDDIRVDFIGIMPKSEGYRIWHIKGIAL